jgi:hypothetical protein
VLLAEDNPVNRKIAVRLAGFDHGSAGGFGFVGH